MVVVGRVARSDGELRFRGVGAWRHGNGFGLSATRDESADGTLCRSRVTEAPLAIFDTFALVIDCLLSLKFAPFCHERGETRSSGVNLVSSNTLELQQMA